MKRIRREDRRVLLALDAIPDKTIQSWIARGFWTVLPLAQAELARRRARMERSRGR